MCGRYTISVSPEELAQHFNAVAPSDYSPRYNAAPSQTLPTLLNESQDGKRQIQMLSWGLVPSWSKTRTITSKLINARGETIAEKPSFRDAFRKRRCLVLADGFYEWQRDGSKKTPMRITLKSGEPFALAGLWENWHDKETDTWLRTFTIITTEPNQLMAPIHNRMPVILSPQDQEAWLDNSASPEIWSALVRSYPADKMMAYAVSKLINKVEIDDRAVMAPA
jgi:putative SOS response-associated peptidase YedK